MLFNYIVWLKPSKTATNWLPLKGLSLIAQINFQRTATSLKTPKFFRNVANAFFPLGDKKPNCRIATFQSAIRFVFRGRVLYYNRATCQRTFVRPPLLSQRRDSQSIRDHNPRKLFLKFFLTSKTLKKPMKTQFSVPPTQLSEKNISKNIQSGQKNGPKSFIAIPLASFFQITQ